MSDFVYKAFRKEEMEFHFNPRVGVRDYDRWKEEKARGSELARQTLKCWLDVPYGSSERQAADIFPAKDPKAPVLIYFHGGYWRGGSRQENAHFAPMLVNAGVTLVVLGYDLCPNVTVADIVKQARSGIAWVYRQIADYGGDPSRLYLSGVSAGGQLVAMALAHDWEKEGLPNHFIKGATAISGVYDLDAVLHISVNEEIGLDSQSARENSPMLHPPIVDTPLIIAVGGDEPSGWKQMSLDFYNLCKDRRIDCHFMEIPGTHHFSITACLDHQESALSHAMLEQIGL